LKSQDIKDYVRENGDLLQKKNVALGTWYNKDDDKTYLDCAIVVGGDRLQEVIASMAKGLGVASRQLAVFDLKAMDEMKVPKNLQSNRAMAIDRSKLALNILPITEVDTWAESPGRYDIRGIDTPPRVRVKGKTRKGKRKFPTMPPPMMKGISRR